MTNTKSKELLSKLRTHWDEDTTNPDSMTAEVKRQCLEDLDEVCKSLHNMKEVLRKSSEEDERAIISATLKRFTNRLSQVNDELGKMGVLSTKGMFWGEIPGNWMDRDEYLLRIKTYMSEIKKFETELASWQPAMLTPLKNESGLVIEWNATMPPPTDFLKGVYEKFHGNGICNQHGKYRAYQNEIIERIQSLTCKIHSHRKLLHNLLHNFKPIDRKKLQEEMDRLNVEKEQLVYDLRVFECNGYAVDFDSHM